MKKLFKMCQPVMTDWSIFKTEKTKKKRCVRMLQRCLYGTHLTHTANRPLKIYRFLLFFILF